MKNLRNGDHRKLGKQETKTIQKSGKYKKRTHQDLTPFLIGRDCVMLKWFHQKSDGGYFISWTILI